MDLAATQIYEDDDFPSTQRISNAPEIENSMQVGTLKVNSTEYPIKRGITKIGRQSICDIVINDATVSKIHAEIEASASQGSTWICDLNSSNRTKLNNLQLRPSRSYELKNGSILEFGRVRATYVTCRPTNDVVIPETPAPAEAPRQRVAAAAATIIPNTPDSSLNNSSVVDDDGSVILGTQRDEANSIFRRPSLPQQRQSTSTDKRDPSRASSASASDDSQIDTALHTSSNDASKNEVSIFDAETQSFEERSETACSIHDVETQGSLDGTCDKTNADTGEPSANIPENVDETTIGSVADIHEMETQYDIDKTGRNDTEAYEIDDKTKSGQRNIHDLETQRVANDDMYDAETQLEVDCNTEAKDDAARDTGSRLKSDGKAIVKGTNANADSSEANAEKITNTSRSSSPRSLNLSSPGVDEHEAYSPLNESAHLLETTDLLEYFDEDVGKRDGIRPSNASTPKPRGKAPSKRDNLESTSNDVSDKEDEDNIFDVPTQRAALSSDGSEVDEKDATCKVPNKRREKSQSKQPDPLNDSETDAEEYLEELAKQKRESRDQSTSNKNDRDTSAESDDMFNLPTQRSSCTDDVRDTSANRSAKVNESDAVVDDSAPTQKIIRNGEDEGEQDERSPTMLPSDINDAPTRLILPNKTLSKDGSKIFSLDDNGEVNDATPTQIIHDGATRSADDHSSDDDRGNADYELAPTQAIDELENGDDGNSKRERSNLDDTLERNLNRMFEDANNDDVEEPASQMSTQRLKDILQSQCDNEVVADVETLTNKRDNIADAEIDSEDSDICLSNFTTKHEKSNDDDDIIARSKERGKPEARDDVKKTVSSEDNKRNLRKRKANATKAIAPASDTIKLIKLNRDSDKDKVDDAEEDLASDTDIGTSCPSKCGQSVPRSDTLHESDDDILSRLPAVRISGTRSNPASPSVSSTPISLYGSKRNDANATPRRSKKSLSRQDVDNVEKDKTPSETGKKLLDSLFADSHDVTNSSESDSETSYNRFMQMAHRMFKSQSHSKQQSKEIAQSTNKSPVSDEKRRTARSTSTAGAGSPRSGVRTRGDFNRRDETRSRVSRVSRVMVDAESTRSGKLTRSRATSSAVANNKRSLMEADDAERTETLKKHKTERTVEEPSIRTRGRRRRPASDRQSRLPNTPERSAGSDSRESSPVIESTRDSMSRKSVSFKITLEEAEKTLHPKMPENVHSTRSKATKRKSINNNASVDDSNDESKAKQAPSTTAEKTVASQMPTKTLMVLLNTITIKKSQEAVVAEASSSKKDENASRRQRNTRSRRNLNAADHSTSAESSSQSSTDTCDNARSDDSSWRPKRGRYKKKELPASLEAEVRTRENNKGTFKRPGIDSSVENEVDENSDEDSTASSSVSIASRLRAGSMRKARLEVHRDGMLDDSISSSKTRRSANSTLSVPTPPRMRRSASDLRNSMANTVKHKILFTGATDDYSKAIKSLGGSKVEDPAKCTILITNEIRRTYKFLCVLATGTPIVSSDWLKDSVSAGRFLDWEDYMLLDTAGEAKFGFKLKKSLERAKEKRLLDGYTVVLTPNVAPPSKQELKDMVTSCGGTALLRPPIKWPERAVIVSRQEDLANARKVRAKAPRTVTVQSTEFILTGILRQEIDFDKHKLM